MDLECNRCHECPPLRPVQLPCCERLHCRPCAWKGILENGKYCWYSSCAGNPKLSYELAILSTEELIKLQELKTKENVSVKNNPKSPDDLQSETEYKFHCRMCSKVYNNIPAYKSHILSHFDSEFQSLLSKSSPYQCPECNVSHKTWHTLVRHYAFKEDKFFSVTKSRPEEFPLLVRKYVRRSVPSKDEAEASPPPPPKKKKKKKRIQDSSCTVQPLTKKRREQTSPVSEQIKIKRCTVNVLEKRDVLRRKRRMLRRQISASHVPVTSSNPDLSGNKGKPSPQTVNVDVESMNRESGEKVIQKTDPPAAQAVSDVPENVRLHFPVPVKIEPGLSQVEEPPSHSHKSGEYFEDYESTPPPGVKKDEKDIIKIKKLEEVETLPEAENLLQGEEMCAVWKIENYDVKEQNNSTEYFEDHESTPPPGVKNEEKDNIKVKKIEKVEAVSDSQTEEISSSQKTEVECEEIIIPKYTKCVCDHPAEGCQLHQSFQMEVVMASDAFLLVKVGDGDGLTKGRIVKFLHNPWLKDFFPSTTRIPFPQMCEVFSDNLVLLSVDSSSIASTNIEVGNVCGICQVWLGHKEAEISLADFLCKNVRIEDDGSFTITCWTILSSRLHLLEVKDLNSNLIIKNRFTFSDSQGFFKIHCTKASIEYLPAIDEMLGRVTTHVEESVRDQIKNRVLEENASDAVENSPAQPLATLGNNGVGIVSREVKESARKQVENPIQKKKEKKDNRSMLAVLQKEKPQNRKNKLAFKVKKSTKASSSNVAELFQVEPDTDTDEEMAGTKKQCKPTSRQEIISPKPSSKLPTKTAATKDPEPQRIPSVTSIVTSPATNTLNLPTPVPAFRACSDCYFSSLADMRLNRCFYCPVYQLKVTEQTILSARSPQHVTLYQDKKSVVTPGYQVFARVFTNTLGTLVIPERLDPKYYSGVIPRPYNNGVLVVIDNQSESPLTLRKDQMIGKGCQFMYIKT